MKKIKNINSFLHDKLKMKDKKRIVILSVLAVIIILLLVLGVTYAFMRSGAEGSKYTNVNASACAKVLFTDTSSSVINMTNSYAMSDAAGLNTTPYTFSVSKTCDGTISFRLYLVSVSGNTIPDSVIKYAITTKGTKNVLVKGKLGSAQDGASDYSSTEKTELKTSLGITNYSGIYKVYSATIPNSGKLEYDLYLWIDKSADNTYMNKSLALGVAVKTGEIFDISNDDVLVNVDYSGNKANLKFANATKTLNCLGNSWDNKLGGFRVTLTGEYPSVECSINATNNSSTTYLNTYITGLSGTTQGTGKVVNENGYRYEGKNPNNYVWFNDELWRIIGVFDSTSHGQSGKNLVKIIRADSIGGLAWHKSNTNDWPNSSLKALLNGAYYDWDTNSSSASTNCYVYSTTVSTTCDYSKKGIKDGYRSMIENVTWYLGGGGKTGYTTYTPDSVYGYERNSAAIYSGRSASTTGYIGLMYESDYLYGVLASSCARTTSAMNAYRTSACAGSNWLYSNSNEGIITPSSSNSYNVERVYLGDVSSGYARIGSEIRPVLYLASSVYKIDGDGSNTNPYIIGM